MRLWPKPNAAKGLGNSSVLAVLPSKFVSPRSGSPCIKQAHFADVGLDVGLAAHEVYFS